MKELDSLATIALTQPHAAHATFTHGLSIDIIHLDRDWKRPRNVNPCSLRLRRVVKLTNEWLLVVRVIVKSQL